MIKDYNITLKALLGGYTVQEENNTLHQQQVSNNIAMISLTIKTNHMNTNKQLKAKLNKLRNNFQTTQDDTSN